ncbi:MAG: LPXTG cell wall anchor domain-containing protein [Clostridiaceae bacterium]|nr:LPXTG cell wall anchor domain-containing protein [Clostridiaceae bacterium]
MPTTVFAAEVRSKADIEAINQIIDDHPELKELGWKKAPTDGSFKSNKDYGWDGKVAWNAGVSPWRISELNLMGENLTGSLDLNGLKALTYLDCSYNQLTGLDVSGLAALTTLDCSYNQLSGTFDVSGLAALTTLDCSYNQLTGLLLNSDASYQSINVTGNCMTDTSAVTGQNITWNNQNYKFNQHYTIKNILTNMTNGNPADRRFVNDMTNYTATLFADPGYMLPDEIEVSVGGTELAEGEDYRYYSEDSGDIKAGYLEIYANSINGILEQPDAVAFNPNSAVCSGGGSGDGDIVIKAAGVPIPIPVYSVSVVVEPEGSGSASATPNAGIKGTLITLNVAPNSGWQFKEWKIVEGAIGISENKFMMPDSNVMVKAVFEKIPAVVEDVEETVTFDPAGGKWEDGEDDPKIIKAKAGTEITIIEAPVREGYEFQYWQGSQYQPGAKYQVPKGGHTFTAVWTKITPTKPSDTTETTTPTGTTTPTETIKLTDPDQTLPKTGESIEPYLWSSLVLLAAGGIMLVLRKKRLPKPKA